MGMIVEDADVTLSEARTSLIKAQAQVHTTKLPVIAPSALEAQKKAEEATAIAQARLDESTFRRQAMVIVVASHPGDRWCPLPRSATGGAAGPG